MAVPFRHSGARLPPAIAGLGANPESSTVHNLWIPGSRVQQQN
jgi:hypothetical protein